VSLPQHRRRGQTVPVPLVASTRPSWIAPWLSTDGLSVANSPAARLVGAAVKGRSTRRGSTVTPRPALSYCCQTESRSLLRTLSNCQTCARPPRPFPFILIAQLPASTSRHDHLAMETLRRDLHASTAQCSSLLTRYSKLAAQASTSYSSSGLLKDDVGRRKEELEEELTGALDTVSPCIHS
jgi:hypothetical protein